MEFSAKQIAAYLKGEIIGDENVTVNTFAKIEEGIPGALSFLSNPKYTHYLYTTKSSIILINKDFLPEEEVRATLIKVDNAYEGLAKLLTLYESSRPKKTGIDSLAYVSPTAKIGEDVYIGAFAYIGDNVEVGKGTAIHPQSYIGDGTQIGEGCILYPHTTIYHGCRIGNECIIHSGAVIGADGFGFAPSENGYEKIPQIGIVIIEDKVEIGANTCIDRATMGATIIHAGAKLDNLIQIAHNDSIGSHTVIAAQVGIAGTAKVGEWCRIGGQVGLSGHLTIGDRVGIGPQSGIMSNVKDNEQIMGSPAVDSKLFLKTAALYKKLPEIYSEINTLRKELNELKQQLKN